MRCLLAHRKACSTTVLVLCLKTVANKLASGKTVGRMTKALTQVSMETSMLGSGGMASIKAKVC